MKKLILTSILTLIATPAMALDTDAMKEKLGGLYPVVDSQCRDKQSLVEELGEYRDQGYPRHRVTGHAMDMVGPDPDLQITFQMVIHTLYERPDVSGEYLGTAVYEGCMESW